jgi:O-antigen/teichoic acid export membrane protein
VIISFFLTPYLIRVLGKEAYSFYPIANNFVQYMGIITTALNSMAARFITIEIARKNVQKTNVYYSSVFYANVILSALLMLPMIGAVVFLDKILNIPIDMVLSIKVLFILVFLSMLVNIITSVFGVAVFAKNRIDLRSVADIVHSVLKLVLYVVLFYLVVPNIIYVGIISVVLVLVTFAINLGYTKKLLPEVEISAKHFEMKSIMEIMSSSLWNSVNQIGSILMFSLSIVFCNVLISTEAGGEYSIIQTIPNFINGIISTLASVFIPSVTQTYATKSISDVVDEVKMSQKFMGVITNIPIVVFMVIGTEFYQLWVPGENAQRLHILSILTVFHLLFIGVTWTINNLNTVINKV